MTTNSNTWDYDNPEHKKQMEEELTQENCGGKLKMVRDISGISRRQLAEVLGVQESTIYRLEKQQSLPSQDFLNTLRALQLLGYARFKNMSKKERSKAAEFICTGAGIGAGAGAAVAAISSAGTIAGLSAAGITSGLAALGGTMLGGMAVVASIPAAAGLVGYGVAKGIKKICKANKLSCSFNKLDKRWEITKDETTKHKEV